MTDQDKKLTSILNTYYQEAQDNALEWQDQASHSWDVIHGRVDWSHKKPGQSKVHLNRVGLALQQIKATITQGLMNFENWIEIEPTQLSDELLSPAVVNRILMRALGTTDVKAKIADNIGIATVENLLTTKLQVKQIELKGPGKSHKELRVCHIPLNIRQYYPDATGAGLYEIHATEIEKYKLMAMSADKPTAIKPYMKSVVKELKPGTTAPRQDEEEDIQEDRGNDTTLQKTSHRALIQVQEFWCTVLDEDGDIMEYKLSNGNTIKLQDVVITVANGDTVISEPKPFPDWDGTSSFVSMNLLRDNDNVYGKGLVKPGVDMNLVENELLNVGIDAALLEGYNVNTAKVHGFADPEQISNGLEPGATYLQNSSLAPGEKLIESLPMGRVPQGVIMMQNIVKATGAENMQLNSRALAGELPSKQVRATEIASGDRSQQSLFEGMITRIEDIYIEKYAKKAFNMVLQNKNLLSDADLMYIFNQDKEKAKAFKSVTAKEAFNEWAHSFKFKAKGIRTIAASIRESQMLMNLMNVAASNPLVGEQFERSGVDITSLFAEALRTQGIDLEKFRSEDVAKFARLKAEIREQALAQGEVQGQQQQPQGAQNPQQNFTDGELVTGNDGNNV